MCWLTWRALCVRPYPKGCLATHGALAHYCAAKNEAHGVKTGDVVLVASPHTFDPSLGDLFASWLGGAG
jgi:non-ribosomal peptide synthetase component F